MNWYRQYPEDRTIWMDRAFIVDGFTKLYVRRFNLAGATIETASTNGSLISRPMPWNYWEAGSFTVLDWDIVISREDVENWEDTIAAAPNEVHVAPCKLYPCSTQLERPVYNHRVMTDNGYKWINSHDRQRYADLVGFGMIYFPSFILELYHENREYRDVLTDATFSEWHRKAIREPIHVEWGIRPIHLHSGYDRPSGQRDDPQIAREPVG